MAQTIVATSPGDIIIHFTAKIGGKETPIDIPLKSISASKSMEVSKEYGIGQHANYADVVGKIGYEGDFTVGSWFVSDEANPSTWNWLIRNFLTFQNDEGLPKEFQIIVMARNGSSMIRQGTGTYGSGDDGLGNTTTVGNSTGLNTTSGSTTETLDDKLPIETYYRCILKGDSTDIPEVGGTVSKKYPFSAMMRDPK